MQAAQQTMPPVRREENAQMHEQGLSFLSLTSLVIASMIGAGVFTTFATMRRNEGNKLQK
jgi:hypothetical protein